MELSVITETVLIHLITSFMLQMAADSEFRQSGLAPFDQLLYPLLMKQSQLNLIWKLHQEVRQSNFTDDLIEKVRNDLIPSLKYAPGNPLTLYILRGISLASELLDQTGHTNEAKSLIEGIAQEFLEEFQTIEKDGIDKCKINLIRECNEMGWKGNSFIGLVRVLGRQKAWCAMQYVYVLRNSGDLSIAEENVGYCDIFVNKVLSDDVTFPCYGTKSRLNYFKGLIHLSQGKLDQAKEAFDDAMKMARKRLDNKIKRAEETYGTDRTDNLFATNRAEYLPPWPPQQEGSAERIRRELSYARDCVAKILAFGIAQIFTKRGQLKTAASMLEGAMILSKKALERGETPSEKKEEQRNYRESISADGGPASYYLSEHISLRYGIVARQLAGYDIDELENAEIILEECLYAFGGQPIDKQLTTKGTNVQQVRLASHSVYKILCEYQLALINLYRYRAYRLKKRPDREESTVEYEKFLRDASKYATRIDLKVLSLRKWKHNKFILESRICREGQKYEEACEHAEKAMNTAKDSGSSEAIAESYIALGEAYLDLAQYYEEEKNKDRAEKYFEKARGAFDAARIAGEQSDLLVGTSLLHLTRWNLLRNKVGVAREFFREWQSFSSHIENGVVLEMAQEIEEKLKKRKIDFRIALEDLEGGKIDYKTCQEELHQWLFERALERAEVEVPSQEGETKRMEWVAIQLNVGRSTVYKWKKEREQGNKPVSARNGPNQ